VRSFLVVVPPPSLDFDPRFLEAVEDLTIRKLIAQLAIEALAVAILPRALNPVLAYPLATGPAAEP
jgi:hypothetical protein